ncbi:MAG: hypothetical protein M3068_09290 [Gemmatimonadota bacterium]|nr:hypothetical protein [Gemmatimonadota bacterium]
MKSLGIRTLAIGAAFAALPMIAQAQGHGHGRNQDGVPPGQHPPAGMCRVWIDGVPPGQQSAPTDCATATHNVPANGHVIYGDDHAGKNKGKKWKKDKHRDNDDERARGKHDDDDDRARGDHQDDHDRDQHRGDHDAGRVPDPHQGGAHLPFPSMSDAAAYQHGQVLPEVTQWLGNSVTSVTYAGNRAVWSNAAGQILQVWTDSNGDGRADKIEFYEQGRVVRVIP